MLYHYINNLYFTGPFPFLGRLLVVDGTKSALLSDREHRPFCSAQTRVTEIF